jgi:hypothetical protein
LRNARFYLKEFEKSLLTILVVAFLATTAKAGLGWTLEDCTQHYGRSEYTSTDTFTGVPTYHFKAKGFEITVVIGSEDRVVEITYFATVISEEDIKNLLDGNAPTAEGKKHVSGKTEICDGFESGVQKFWAYFDHFATLPLQALNIRTSEAVELRESWKERKAKALQDL